MLGSDGNKMAKSLRNYPDVREVFDRDGADAMRWFLMAAPILRGGNLVVTEQGIRDAVRFVMIPLWNSWYFFQLYANAFGNGQGYDAKASTTSADPLDRYLLAKCRQYVEQLTAEMDELRHRRRVRDDARLPRRAHELVHPPLAGPVLGRQHARPSTRSTRCSRRSAGSPRRCCR